MILGGGPAGATLATLLARAGRRVILIEREARPHDKVCGEFISGEAAGYLQRLGLDLLGLGAVAIRRVRLAARGPAAEHALPFPALSLSRRRLDEALLGMAADAGAELRRGARARSLGAHGGGWRATIDGGEDAVARHAFLATGKRDLVSHRRPPGLHDDLVGFKMHLRLAPAQSADLGDAVELHLFPGGYAGLEPIEDGLANLCLVIGEEALAGHSWSALLRRLRTNCPGLARRLEDGQALWPKPLAVAAIPYGYVARAKDEVWRLGDQAAVIPSFAGDGLGIALHSAHAAAAAHLDGQTAQAFQARLAMELGPRVKAAALLSRLLVRPWAQTLAVAATRLRPQLLPATAALTRIPEKALDRLRPGPVPRGTAGNSPPSGRRSDCPA